MLRTIKFILDHPLTKGKPVNAILGFLKWQLRCRVYRKPIVHQFTPESKLYVWKGLTGATGNVYCGLHEFEDMGFLLHFLRAGDLFVDVGANIGSYTILASAEVGANTVAIEPVLSTFNNLYQNILLNNATDKIEALNIGISSKKGTLKFSKHYDTGNHVVDDNSTDFEEIQVCTLDEVLAGRQPVLLKIDVEGFETEVLNGAEETLQSETLRAIIIELNGAGDRYGYNDDDIHQKLINNGFKAFKYNTFERTFTETTRNNKLNTLYLRDTPFIEQRVATAKQIKIKCVEF